MRRTWYFYFTKNTHCVGNKYWLKWIVSDIELHLIAFSKDLILFISDPFYRSERYTHFKTTSTTLFKMNIHNKKWTSVPNDNENWRRIGELLPIENLSLYLEIISLRIAWIVKSPIKKFSEKIICSKDPRNDISSYWGVVYYNYTVQKKIFTKGKVHF